MRWELVAALTVICLILFDFVRDTIRRLRGAKRCTRCGRWDQQFVAVQWEDKLIGGTITSVLSVDWTLCRRCTSSLGEQFDRFRRFGDEFKARTAEPKETS